MTNIRVAHPIADAHPGNLDEIIFPGQDFNNARIYDFDQVNNWAQNKRELQPVIVSLIGTNNV